MMSAHHLRQGTEKQELLRLIGTVGLEVPEGSPAWPRFGKIARSVR